MKVKRHSPEQIIRKLRTAEQLLNQGQVVAEVVWFFWTGPIVNLEAGHRP